MKTIRLAALLLAAILLAPWPAAAQGVRVITTCGTLASPLPVGSSGQPLFMDITGTLCTSSTGGGGGGAVTVADGADVTQGAIADAASTAGGTGTLSAKLRLMTTQIGTLNTSLGTINTTLGTPLQAGGNIGTVSTLTTLSQFGGQAITLGAGAVAGGTLRITQASDSPEVAVLGAIADAASATGSISAKLRFIASTGIPITGTVTVGSHAVTNVGTFAVQSASATAPVSTMNSASANSGLNAAIAGVFDDATPTSITENSFGFARMSANRNLYYTLRDAAGNERGANVDSSNRLSVAIDGGSQLNANQANNVDDVAAVGAGSTAPSPVLSYGMVFDGTTWDRMRGSSTTGVTVTQSGQYPVGATPITASNTGTTGATTATLAGTSGKTTYICGYSIRANATAAATVTNTITGTITATLSSIMWVAPLASGIGIDEQIFSPCVPASATNTGIAIVSGAPGSGGAVSSKGWGYQL